MVEVGVAQNKGRGWGIKMARNAVLGEVGSWIRHWDKKGIYGVPILVGGDSLMCQLAFAEQWPHNLTGITTFSPKDNTSWPLTRAIVMGGDYPYRVIIVDKPADYENGRAVHIIELSRKGVNMYIQSLDGSPEHIQKAIALIQG